jgi:hypothetical protein
MWYGDFHFYLLLVQKCECGAFLVGDKVWENVFRKDEMLILNDVTVDKVHIIIFIKLKLNLHSILVCFLW